MSLISFRQDRSEFKQLRISFVAICILVLKQEDTAYELWESLKGQPTKITNYQVIEPISTDSNDLRKNKKPKNLDLPEVVKLENVKLLNPVLSRKERQKKMAFWLMPFGFIAGLTFAGMTNLQTFSNFGFSQSGETILGGLLGMGSGWIGSFFGARSVNTNKNDLKSLIKFNEQGFWLILLETPFEIDPPWQLIREANPIEIINLNLV